MQTNPALNLQRRRFLECGLRSLGLFFLGTGVTRPVTAADGSDISLFNAPNLLGPLLAPDKNGLRLPAGFSSRVIARSGTAVTAGSSWHWHRAPDGGACFAAPDGGWIYVSNSEVKLADGGGGVGAIRFAADGSIHSAYPILQQTDNNCAGGATPWQTWLSCEEVERGLVHECDPFNARSAKVLPALGRFKHEAVAVDPVLGHLYLTEDENDGAFYRFIPANGLPDLSAGTLQVAEIRQDAMGMGIRWHDVPDAAATTIRTSHQVKATTFFDGGEGIAWHAGSIYFTTKGDNRVWLYDIATARLQILYDAAFSATPHLTGVDNVTITASGDVLVAEDGGDMQIVLLSADAGVIPVLQVTGQDASEICGPAFDPSFQRLYFSSQTGPSDTDTDGITYEICRTKVLHL